MENSKCVDNLSREQRQVLDDFGIIKMPDERIYKGELSCAHSKGGICEARLTAIFLEAARAKRLSELGEIVNSPDVNCINSRR
jgi:hypothetical protein